MKKDAVVYVEPGVGWGYVSEGPDEEGNVVVELRKPGAPKVTFNEDDVFEINNETLSHHLRPLIGEIKDYAYSSEINSDTIVQLNIALMELLLIADEAKKRGQVYDR